MTCRVVEKKVAIKKKSARGKYQFGATHSATPPFISTSPLGGDTKGKNKMMGLAALGGYFKNLASAATNEKAVLEELVTNLATLTTSNVDMAATINKIAGGNIQLQQQLNSFKKLLQEERVTGQRLPSVARKPATCTNYKQEVWHNLDNCFELEKMRRGTHQDGRRYCDGVG